MWRSRYGGHRLLAEVTDARLHDPVAKQSTTLPVRAGRAGSVGVVLRCNRADADNVGAARLYRP
ncbi:MAG: hypothetical protein M3Q75_03930, partial [Gemmatimonadota bacterium]|nr:hypothetical protein [Gemmatimonadota bacterium]